MTTFLSKIWKDPVGSAVIGTLISAFAIWIFTQVASFVNGISIIEYYSKEITLTYGQIFFSLFYFFGSVIAIWSLFTALKRADIMFTKLSNQIAPAPMGLKKVYLYNKSERQPNTKNNEYESKIKELEAEIKKISSQKSEHVKVGESLLHEYLKFRESEYYENFIDIVSNLDLPGSDFMIDRETKDYFYARKLLQNGLFGKPCLTEKGSQFYNWHIIRQFDGPDAIK